MGGICEWATAAPHNAPEKGMITSLGRGMQALSIAMSTIMPGYPSVLMTLMDHCTIGPRIFSTKCSCYDAARQFGSLI
jgi:hypothetical protein